MGRVVAGVILAILLFFVAFYAAVNRVSIDPAELLKRCAESHPEWLSYQEDIKGQIGAGAAAEWQGTPLRAEVRGREAHVTMRISGPWAQYDCGIPILLRDPLGNVVQSSAVSAPGGERTYTFKLPTETPPPWIEIHYPHQERRLPLSPQGDWQAPDTN